MGLASLSYKAIGTVKLEQKGSEKIGRISGEMMKQPVHASTSMR